MKQRLVNVLQQSGQRLTFAVLFSFALHAFFLFGITFVVPDSKNIPVLSQPLEVVLVNSKSGRRPNNASAYAQNNGKVKMSTVAAPHQGLGVSHYAWSSSPLRRYVDLVNQRQIMSVLRDEAPAYARNDTALYAILRDFDAAYTAYNDFQREMERYWCLRWLQQEQVTQVAVTVLRENLVKLNDIPLVGRIHALPETPAGTQLMLEIVGIDLLTLDFDARPLAEAHTVA